MTTRRGFMGLLAAGAAAIGLPGIGRAVRLSAARADKRVDFVPPPAPVVPPRGPPAPEPLCWFRVQNCVVTRIARNRATTFTSEGWIKSEPGPVIVNATFVVPKEHEDAYMAWLTSQTR